MRAAFVVATSPCGEAIGPSGWRNSSASDAPGFVGRDQGLGIEVHADRVLREGLGLEIGRRLGLGLVAIDLQLDRVAVGIVIVHRQRRPVMDRPIGLDAGFLQAAIGRQQLADIAEGVGDVRQPPAPGIGRLQAGDVHDRQPMVLLVVGQEADEVVALHDMHVEHRRVPVDHRRHVGRAQHEVREQRRRDRLGVEGTGRENSIHGDLLWTASLRPAPWRGGLLHLDAGVIDHPLPISEVRLLAFGEGLGRAADRIEAPGSSSAPSNRAP